MPFPRPDEPSREPADEPRLAPITVFLVDQDDAVRDALAVSAEAAGMRVVPFRSAAEFLDSYRAGTSGCLVVEMDLPGIDGGQLLGILTARAIRLPAVAMSGRLESRKLARRLAGDGVFLLEKPFGGERLIAAIRDAVGRAEAKPAWDEARRAAAPAGSVGAPR